jgi:hypothetical protein
MGTYYSATCLHCGSCKDDGRLKPDGVANLGKAFQVGERHDETDGAAFGVLQDAAQVRRYGDRRRAESVERSQAPGSHLRSVRTDALNRKRERCQRMTKGQRFMQRED